MARLLDIDGRGKKGIVRFEAELLWIREVRPQVLFMHGGRVLKEGGAYCDVGRFGRSLDDAAEEAERLARVFSVGPGSSLEILVRAAVTEFPVLPPEGGEAPRAFWGRRQYAQVPDDWMFDETARIEACMAHWRGEGDWPEDGLPKPQTVELAEGDTWTSRRSPAENVEAAARFRAAWNHTPG